MTGPVSRTRASRAVLGAVFTVLVQAAGADDARKPPVALVEAGPFQVLIVEEAELAARRSVTIASDLPSNSAKIAWLAADGAAVAKDDLIVRFDAEPFQEAAEKAARDYADAHASLLQAEAEMQVLVRRGEDADAGFAHQIELAELRLAQFRSAERVLRLANAANEVLAARAALETARSDAETQRQLLEEGLGSAGLLKEAEAKEREKRSALSALEQRARLLEEIVLPGEEQEAELELERKRLEREAAQQAHAHSLAKQHAAIMGLRSRLEACAAELERARARLARLEVRAPVAGFAIQVPTSVGNAFRKAQVGDSVWERHGFIVIPDMSELVAQVRVREVDVGKVEPAQPVVLHPLAYPDLVLPGRVEAVGALAERIDGTGDNEFSVLIAVERGDARLRPGMRARAEIRARHFSHALHVPVEAVFRDNGEWVVFVWNGRRTERRVVELGDSDGARVVVDRGVDAGDRVLLAYPGQSVSAR